MSPHAPIYMQELSDLVSREVLLNVLSFEVLQRPCYTPCCSEHVS